MLVIRECEITEAQKFIGSCWARFQFCVVLDFQHKTSTYFEKISNFFTSYGFFPHYYIIFDFPKPGEAQTGVIFGAGKKLEIECVGDVVGYLAQAFWLPAKQFWFFAPTQENQELQGQLEAAGFSNLMVEDLAALLNDEIPF